MPLPHGPVDEHLHVAHDRHARSVQVAAESDVRRLPVGEAGSLDCDAIPLLDHLRRDVEHLDEGRRRLAVAAARRDGQRDDDTEEAMDERGAVHRLSV